MPNKFYNQSWFNWLILIIITAGLGWFFYTQFYVEPVDWGDDEKSELGIKNQEMPIGVIVNKLENGDVLVINKNDGFQVKINKTDYLYKDEITGNNLVVQNFGEPKESYGGIPGCRVTIEKKDGSLKNIEEEVKNECDTTKTFNECDNYSLKSIKVGGVFWFDIRYFGNFIGSGWPELKTEHNGSVYSLIFLCNDQEYINNILKNFSFIN